jgi:hypothetical protein
LDGSLRRVRGGWRKEKGTARRTWKRGSIESNSDLCPCAAAAAAAAALPAACSDLGAIASGRGFGRFGAFVSQHSAATAPWLVGSAWSNRGGEVGNWGCGQLLGRSDFVWICLINFLTDKIYLNILKIDNIHLCYICNP